jgi:type IV pilus assembly protein PilY1
MKKIIYLLLLTLTSFLSQAFAHDTDIYVLDQSMAQVPPDALIVLDLSGSMKYTPAGSMMFIPGTNCSIEGPFYPTSGTGHTHACSNLSQTSGPIYGDSLSCSGPFYIKTGTRTLDGHSIDFSTNCSKLAIAKRGVFRFLDADDNGTINATDEDTLKMRMGYMRFYDCGDYSSESGTDYTAGCNTLIKSTNTKYSKIYCNNDGGCFPSDSAPNSVSGENATGSTPLAPALSEAKLYLDATKVGDTAASCRQKFVILLTDGEDTLSCNGNGTMTQSDQYKRRRQTIAKAKALADAGYLVFVLGFGADMPHYLKNTLNWAAYYGGTDNPGVVNSITSMYSIPYGMYYPSGITSCQNSSTSHHNLGEGDHYYATSNDPGEKGVSGYAFLASDATQLRDAIDAIRNYIIAILAKSTSYVAPVVPISQMEKTSSGNRMYLGMFKPTIKSFWKGNIKKYGIAIEDTETIKIGDIIDAKTPPELVMGPQNKIVDTAKSYWSSVVDGGEVDKGGVGEILLARNLTTDPRKIYTYLGTNPDLTHSSNAFNLSNTTITTTTLAVSTSTERDNIIKFVHGWDAWDWNKNGIFDEKRDWILGAFIHSRPLVIHYSDRSVVYAGANDGMLHAFDDATGEELWAFIPPNLLTNLKKFDEELSLQLFVDGSPKAYEGTSQTVLMVGDRRGGERYIALNITNPLSPTFLWEISSSRTGYEELGQTWSTPRIGKVKNGSGEKWVAFISGGYDDTHQDPQPPLSPPDAKGTAIYAVDILTGDLIWKYSRSKDSTMNYSIASDIARVDTNGDGYIDRLYVGDMGGRIWRFDIGDVNETATWTGKIIFAGSGKIFYPPDVTLEKDSVDYEMIFFGTGDRENPKDASFINKLYAVKDKNPGTPLTESNLVDVTLDLLQDPSTPDADKIALMNDLKNHDGWYIRLNQNSGEKCLAESVVFGGTAYYTTFSPTLISPSDICLVGEGQGRIYALKYKTGNAAFNLDVSNDLGITKVINREDRLLNVGKGIPSGVILTVIGDTVTGYAGVAGGVYSPILSNRRAVVPTSWRIVF